MTHYYRIEQVMEWFAANAQSIDPVNRCQEICDTLLCLKPHTERVSRPYMKHLLSHFFGSKLDGIIRHMECDVTSYIPVAKS